MLTLPSSVRIYLASEPTDMRKGFDGLCRLVEESLGHDIYEGHLFVFVSRRQDRVKVLMWERGGFVLYYKRLERGRFRLPAVGKGATCIRLAGPQLAMLLDGIDVSRVRKPTHWQPNRTKRIDRTAQI